MVKAQKYIISRRFDGFPKPGDLELVEEELPPLKDGGKNKLYGISMIISLFILPNFILISL